MARPPLAGGPLLGWPQQAPVGLLGAEAEQEFRSAKGISLCPTVPEAEGDPGCRRAAAEGAEEDKGS